MNLTNYLIAAIDYLRCRKVIHMDRNTKYKYYSSICVIAKNEEQYIKEWIEHHLKLGFEHIYIIDNNDIYGLRDFLYDYENSGVITIVNFVSIKPSNQEAAYLYCLKNYGKECKWMAFIDVDEFVFMKKNKFINDFLILRESYSAICMNWKCYGFNNQINKKEEKVFLRFAKPSSCSKRDFYFKSIIRPNIYWSLQNGHMGAHRWTFPVFDEMGKLVIGELRRPTYEYIELRHYYTKSVEEFVEKLQRGCSMLVKRDMKDLGDFLDGEDLAMIPLIEEYIRTNKIIL